MASLAELEQAVHTARHAGCKQLVLLKCTSTYPASPKNTNISSISALRERYDCEVGLSDHTLGIGVACASISFGATIIEKHLTLDRNLQGPDHKASLEPHQFTEMVKGIRTIECALGDGIKKPTHSEIPNKLVARKSLVASQPIKKGDIFSEFNVTSKRPGSGISPMYWDSFLGRTSSRHYLPDELLEW